MRYSGRSARCFEATLLVERRKACERRRVSSTSEVLALRRAFVVLGDPAANVLAQLISNLGFEAGADAVLQHWPLAVSVALTRARAFQMGLEVVAGVVAALYLFLTVWETAREGAFAAVLAVVALEVLAALETAVATLAVLVDPLAEVQLTNASRSRDVGPPIIVIVVPWELSLVNELDRCSFGAYSVDLTGDGIPCPASWRSSAWQGGCRDFERR